MAGWNRRPQRQWEKWLIKARKVSSDLWTGKFWEELTGQNWEDLTVYNWEAS
jgi:hypothetical protein